MTVTHPRQPGRSAASPAAEALARARDHLLGLQHAAGLVAGRAGDQRHHGRRGPAAAGVPRRPDRRADAGRGPVDRLQAARRRHLGELLRRPRRPVHHGGGLRRAAAGRARAAGAAHGPGGGVDPRPGRDPGHPGVHPDLARPVRRMVLGRPAGHAAGADLPARLVPVQRLRLGVLGAPDHSAADHRRGVPASHAASVRAQRAVASRCRADRARAPGPRKIRLGCRVRRPGPGAARLRAARALILRAGPGRRLRRHPATPGPRRCGRCAAPRSAGAPSGSSPGRRPTAAGAASSRRGCTR